MAGEGVVCWGGLCGAYSTAQSRLIEMCRQDDSSAGLFTLTKIICDEVIHLVKGIGLIFAVKFKM